MECEKLRNLISIYSNENFFTLQQGTFYLGVDPTGVGLHLGHLLPVFLATKLLELGFKGIILIGGFTGQIGDPTGKTNTREKIDTDLVQNNTESLFDDMKHIFQDKVTYVNNKDWLEKMPLSELMMFLEKFSVTKKLHLDIFNKRIASENPLYMNEFLYPDLQAIDFYFLNKHYGCNIQIGGRDQWGNLSYGVHCMNKLIDGDTFAIATPLLEHDGKKMGKSEGNAILIRDMAIYQYILQLPDSVTGTLCKFFLSSYSDDPIEQKHQLGEFIITFYHGKHSTMLTQVREFANSISNLTPATNEIIYVNKDSLSNILYDNRFIESKTEIKRLFHSNSIYLNKEHTSDIIFNNTQACLLSIGKKKHYWICVK